MINDINLSVKQRIIKFYEVFSQFKTIKIIGMFIHNTIIKTVTIYERSLYG
jgi:hypothetical protein